MAASGPRVHLPFLSIFLVLAAVGLVVFAWPAPEGIALVVLTAVGSVGLVPRWLEHHRLEAIVLAKGASVVMLATGWIVSVWRGLGPESGADAALAIVMIGMGAQGLLLLGMLEAEVRATANIRKRLKIRSLRTHLPPPSTWHQGTDPSDPAGVILRGSSDAQGVGIADDDSTGALTDDELRALHAWSARALSLGDRDTDSFSSSEIAQMRAVAAKLRSERSIEG